MLMGGTIYDTDRRGNAMVRPDGGGRPVVLRHSSRGRFRSGQHVLYDGLLPGRSVDFTDNYKFPVQSHAAPPGLATGALDVRIRNTLSRCNLHTNSVIIAYDPAFTAGGTAGDAMPCFHYLALARSASAADSVVGQINRLFNPPGKWGIVRSGRGMAGRQGELPGVQAARFALRISELSHDNLAVVPITGIVSRINGDALIAVPVMETCLRQAAIVLGSVARN